MIIVSILLTLWIVFSILVAMSDSSISYLDKEIHDKFLRFIIVLVYIPLGIILSAIMVVIFVVMMVIFIPIAIIMAVITIPIKFIILCTLARSKDKQNDR
ncbi:cellulose synthase/poly-beta-1,6-N-acetylglucosamine synthase-like glycosyltransferase [Halalkalibacter oceani]